MNNKMHLIMRNILLALTVFTLCFSACKKTEELEPTRLFRPVLKDQLVAEGNWVEARWQQISSAKSYTVQLSMDTFRTVMATMNTDTNYVRFNDLGWEKTYQVQVRANAPDTTFNSRYSLLGSIKTPRFPTILNVPGVSEVTDAAVKVTWSNSGAPVTRIRIIKTADSSLVREVDVTQTDISNQYRIISGLASSTKHTILLYSETTLRGWADFTTKTPFTGTVIDLRDIEGRPSVLADTIPVIPAGSTVLLKRGETYEISSTVDLGKNIIITSGSDLMATEQAKLYFNSNFNFAEGSVIDSIEFNDVYLVGSSYSSRYVFNTTRGAQVGKMKFVNCHAEIFRGLVRLQSGTTMVSNFIIENSTIDSISNYGVIIVDNATCKAGTIVLRNSTFYKAEKIITSSKNDLGGGIVIENCTFNETPLGGGSNYIIDAGSKEVPNGITVNNNIFGMGKPNPGNGSVTIRDFRASAATTVNASNNYRTADYESAGSDLPNVINYTRKSTELWQDAANGNFKIVDNLFPGRSSAGDPRWRL
ncbi:MAG: DUF5123 domain-containing protein [Chitinophagaceae bacterium]|nr:MAG: DUF5123 domain-containing protein [Chitinophagaceae bacterium]